MKATVAIRVIVGCAVAAIALACVKESSNGPQADARGDSSANAGGVGAAAGVNAGVTAMLPIVGATTALTFVSTLGIVASAVAADWSCARNADAV